MKLSKRSARSPPYRAPARAHRQSHAIQAPVRSFNGNYTATAAAIASYALTSLDKGIAGNVSSSLNQWNGAGQIAKVTANIAASVLPQLPIGNSVSINGMLRVARTARSAGHQTSRDPVNCKLNRRQQTGIATGASQFAMALIAFCKCVAYCSNLDPYSR